MRVRVKVKGTATATGTETGTETVPETGAPAATISDPVASEVIDIASKLQSALDGAAADGIVDSIDVKRGRRSAAPVAAAPVPSPLSGMDLAMLSDMIWEAVGRWRGWDVANAQVDKASRKNWGEALAPVLEKLLGEIAQEHAAEITLLIATLLIILPRETVAYKYRKQIAEAAVELDRAA